jgi:hypothetical protein
MFNTLTRKPLMAVLGSLALQPLSTLASRAVVVAGLLLAFCGLASAQGSTAVWNSIGPAGGTVNALLTIPSSPATIYAGTPEDGIFVSRDTGATWASANVGLPPTTAIGRQTLYAVYGLATDGAFVYAATASGLFYAAIGGAPTWQPMASTGSASPVTLLAFDPNTKRLFAAGGANGGAVASVYVASVGSAAGPLAPWVTAPLPVPAGAPVGALAIVPAAPGTLSPAALLASVGTSLFTASIDVADAGLNWIDGDASASLSASSITSLHYSPEFQLAYACNAGAVFYSGNVLDAQVIWLPATVATSSSAAFTCNAFATVPIASGAVPQVVLGTDQGIFASPDGVNFAVGGTTGIAASANAFAIGSDAGAPVSVVLTGTNFGVFKTGADTLSGQPSWAAINGPASTMAGGDNLRLNNANIGDLAILGSTLYAAAVTDQYVEVLASADGGATWRATGVGSTLMAGEQVTSLAADGAHSALYAATTQGLLSYSPTSNRWSTVGASTIVGRVGALAVGTGSLFIGTDTGLFAIALSGAPSGSVPVAAGLTGVSVRALHVAGGSVYAATINPDDSNFIYSAPEASASSGTATWTPFGVGSAGTDRVTSLLLVGTNLLAATNGSLVLYASQGSAWASANISTDPSQQITDAFGAVNSLYTDGVSIYASTGSNGVFVSPFGSAFAWSPFSGSGGSALPSVEVHTLRASGSTLYAATRGGIAAYSGIGGGGSNVVATPTPDGSGGGAVDTAMALFLMLLIVATAASRRRR